MRRVTALADSGTVITANHLSSSICSARKSVLAVPKTEAAPGIYVSLDQPLEAAVEHLERAMIRHALDSANGRLEEAASTLGISRKGLYLKRQRLGFGLPTTGDHSQIATD